MGDFDHEFECTFKGVSIVKEKASVGLAIPRSDLDPDQADEVFCGAQLRVKLEADPNAKKREDPGQMKLVESGIDFGGIANCAGFGVKSGLINLTLQFQKAEVALDQLGKFAGLKGKVLCTRTGDCDGTEAEADPSGG